LIELYCAELNIYLRNSEDEKDRLSKLYYFLETVLNKENRFFPYSLESVEWYHRVKWSEGCYMTNRNDYVKFKNADITIDIGDENNGLAFELKKYDNYKICIRLYRDETMYTDNRCLDWHQNLINLLIENNIVDTAHIYRGKLKNKPKWYSLKKERNFYIGKEKFIILHRLHGLEFFSEKKKDILVNFINNHWDELQQENTILDINKKDVENILQKSKNGIFSHLLEELSKISYP